MEDFIIGKDIVFRENEALHDLIQSLPLKAQLGPKGLVDQVRGLKEHGFQHLFNSLKEKAHDNLGNVDIVYTSFDVSHNVVALGSNLGMIFFFDRNNKKLTRFSSETVHEPITFIKLLSLQSFLASGHSNGAILIFSYLLSSKAMPKAEYYPVSSVHSSAVTCLEWSPDGTLLYSGDEEGKIAVNIIKVPERVTQTALLFSENASVVQLSYSHSTLLASTTKRTVLWDFKTEQPTQVGQKERKSPGPYGACFYPPARILPEKEKEPSLTVYAARPGLRLWTADTNGKVFATLMYKGLMNGNPPGIRSLTPLLSPSLAAATRIETVNANPPQFGRLEIFHGQFVVTWDCHRLWVLDTSPCALVCYHHSYHGNIIDVSTVGHEVYILLQKSPRLIKKISLIPKMPNPLLPARTILLKSEKMDSLHVENGVVTVPKDSDSTLNNVLTMNQDMFNEQPHDLVVLATKLQNVVEEDYGDIVFKPKRSSKKKNKGIESFTEQKESFPDADSTTDKTSDISSELDFADRSVSNRNSGDENSLSFGPSVTLVNVGHGKGNVTEEPVDSLDSLSVDRRDPLSVDHLDPSSVDRLDPSSVDRLDPSSVDRRDPSSVDRLHPLSVDRRDPIYIDDIPNEEHSIYSLSSTETIERTLSLDSCSQTLTPVRKLSQEDESTPSNNVGLHERSKDESPLGLDDSHNFPQIYSTTPLHLSDLSFSDKSLDRSTPGHRKNYTQRPVDSSMSVIDSESCPMEKSRANSQETPPLCLDADGAEELGDAVSWSSSSRTLSDFDMASLEFINSIERTYTSQVSQNSKSSANLASQNVHLLVDSWSDVRYSFPGYVISLDVSDLHIWVVTNYDTIYYCPTHFETVSWTKLEGQAKLIAVNNSGDVIWCVDGKNAAFARNGIREGNLTGREWLPVEKNIRHVAIDDTTVWGILINGDVIMRTQVSKEKPAGTSMKTIAVSTNYVQVSCLDGLAWFVDSDNLIHVYKGLYQDEPERKENWHCITDIPAKWVCLKIYGWSWIVDTKGSLWFTDKVAHESPEGCEWYQVSLGQYLMQDRSLLDTLWSWVRRGDETKLLTASPKAGMWILGKNGSLNSSRGHLLGGHWQSITPKGIAKSVFWSYISARGYYSEECKGNLWALQPSGELICFQPGNRTIAVESPRTVLKLVAASLRTVWGISHDFRVVQRIGVINNLCPQGVDWKIIELSSFQVGRVCHISSGTLCTWAVDESGSIWLRIGDIEKTDQAISQVWLQVDGEPIAGCRFVKVAVSPDDAVVWALDDRFNVYARRDVAPNFQVGTVWDPVPGILVKDACITGSHLVWAVCANGDIACRYGVTKTYPLGNYWKKVPGNFEHISVTPDGQLWAINLRGQLFLRKTKHFYGTQSPLKERKYSCLFSGEDEWEII